MQTPLEELRTLGNTALLRLPKTAFFCSRDYPHRIERLSYLWAMEQRQLGYCVLSGFHSQLEQSIFRFLRRDVQQPIVYVLGRGIQPALPLEYERDIQLGRLLFVTPFDREVSTVTQETANIRNLLIADMADRFFIPYMRPGGNLEQLLQGEVIRGKPLLTLNLPENRELFRRGARLYQPPGLLGGHRARL
ncbi:DNA-binding protein [Hymenobacter metallilatus]|uniref:DNA-binding protein n=1 Tax=Hymenobacter metallilatus TaxID=2493666 RepID=A0A428JTH9_9BACT|nr:DNA-binding protein [Hymenobacter metallilatus]RSK37344.1 DNA-binding protein [Hymenobacter metallilatus]